MKVDLTALEESQIPFDLSFPAGEFEFENLSTELTEDVCANGVIRKRSERTNVDGQIRGRALFECSRCLTQLRQSLKISFTAGFVVAESSSGPSDRELNSEDLEISEIENDLIDIREIVREQILLAIPDRVFCRDDCKGLCRICGEDKNLINCNCEEKEIDPRWAALKNLK